MGDATEPAAFEFEIRAVAVLGAGAAGLDLALLSARAGYRTSLEDLIAGKLRLAQERVLSELADEPGARARLSFATSIEDAVRNADMIIDCVPDELESKLEIFSLADRMAPPRTIFCTPTNVLSISDLASCTYRAEQCIAIRPAGIDWLQSPTICLVTASQTSDWVSKAVTRFWESTSKSVEVVREQE